jgi:hypothetical protein
MQQPQQQQDTGAVIPQTWKIDHKYNYPLPAGGDIKENVYIELEEMVSESGIAIKVSNGRKRISMAFRLDLSIESHKKMAQKFLEIHAENARFLGTVKNDVGKQHFKASEPLASNYKSGLHFRYDDNGQIDWSVAPMLFVDLYDYKNKQTVFRTPMTPEEADDPDFEPPEVPWDALKDKIVTMIPTIHYVKTSIGVVISEKIFLDSGIITKPPEENVKTTRNRGTAMKYGTDRDLVSAIRKQTQTIGSSNLQTKKSFSSYNGNNNNNNSNDSNETHGNNNNNSNFSEFQNESSGGPKFKIGSDGDDE